MHLCGKADLDRRLVMRFANHLVMERSVFWKDMASLTGSITVQVPRILEQILAACTRELYFT